MLVQCLNFQEDGKAVNCSCWTWKYYLLGTTTPRLCCQAIFILDVLIQLLPPPPVLLNITCPPVLLNITCPSLISWIVTIFRNPPKMLPVAHGNSFHVLPKVSTHISQHFTNYVSISQRLNLLLTIITLKRCVKQNYDTTICYSFYKTFWPLYFAGSFWFQSNPQIPSVFWTYFSLRWHGQKAE